MQDELLLAAVRNNAGWCDAVCRARGVPGRFTDHLWINEHATPPYYPNIITLLPASDGLLRELDDAMASVHDAVGDKLSIKDSFADVDLATHGCRVLFDAQWIARADTLAAPATVVSGVAWSIVREAAGLEAWKNAWDAEIVAADPIFAPSLLHDADIAFVAGHRRGAIVGGGIANKSAGVVGLSNVFASANDRREAWAGCIAIATAWAPGMPIVGYESGVDLATALELGFAALGPLRVWVASGR